MAQEPEPLVNHFVGHHDDEFDNTPFDVADDFDSAWLNVKSLFKTALIDLRRLLVFPVLMDGNKFYMTYNHITDTWSTLGFHQVGVDSQFCAYLHFGAGEKSARVILPLLRRCDVDRAVNFVAINRHPDIPLN